MLVEGATVGGSQNRVPNEVPDLAKVTPHTRTRDAREQDRERRLGDGEPAERDDERDELVTHEQADADTPS